MPSQYSPKTFLRQVRSTLLSRCLRRQGVELDFNREPIKPADIDQMFQRLMSIPPEKLRLIEGDFASISQLASSAGTEAILREARRRGLDFSDLFMRARNGYERACWTFLEHPAVFELAECFEEMDGFGDGRWNRRYVGAHLVPTTSSESLTRLSQLIRHSFAKEGRGQNCHIDHYIRQDPLRHCFFAFPEDHASTDLTYTERGELRRHTRKSAFEVIFVYRPEDGVLEVLAPGGADRVEDLASCFCAAILNLSELPPKIGLKLYDLSRLKTSDLYFPTDPDSGIDRVELREVRLNLGRDHGWKRRLSFAADDKSFDRASIHEMILDTISADGIPLSDVIVSSARFRILFVPVDNQHPKRLTFTITVPDRCTLRDNHHDHIARKHLRRWGLVVDSLSSAVAAWSGQARAERLWLG